MGLAARRGSNLNAIWPRLWLPMLHQTQMARFAPRAPVVLCLALVFAGAHSARITTDQNALINDAALEGKGGVTECDLRENRKATLRLIKEEPFIGLFHHLRNQTIFEASGLALVNGTYYVVFDSSESLGFLDDEFHFRGAKNRLIRDKGEEDSQFEGIAYIPEDNTFLLLKEAVEHGNHFHAHIVHARLTTDGDSWDELRTCKVKFALSAENKGFESIIYTHNSKGAWLMGLCEGNFCQGGAAGRTKGNGRIVLSTLVHSPDGSCSWETDKVLEIPRRAEFSDYSAMAFAPSGTKLAILSQADAKVWIGDFDREEMRFLSKGQVFTFPKTNRCETVYCNVEGVQWIDERRIVVTSDKAKSYQPFYCDSKDQMVHIFALPAIFHPDEIVDPYLTPEGDVEERG